MKKILQALIFDLDGTLIKLILPLETMRRTTKAYFIKHGFPSHLFEQGDGISSSIIKARFYFLSQGVLIQEWEVMQNRVDDILTKIEMEVADKAEALDGVVDIIKQVRALRIKTAILTNNALKPVSVMLEHLPFDGLFDFIQTRQESLNPKPYPDGLLLISQKLGVNLTEVIYVGDSVVDLIAAQRAGIEFWGVLTGSATREELQSKGANVLMNSVHEILPLIQSRIDRVKN